MIPTDVLSLIIFVLCIALFVWDKFPMATTAVLGCTVMVIAGVCDFKTAFGQFASSTVILTIGVMVIGAAIAETGLANTIGATIVKAAKNSEKKLIIGTYLVSSIMSAFLTNSAVLAIFIPIIMGLSKASDSKIEGKNLIMPIAYGCVIGGASTLVGSTQQMTAQGLLEGVGAKTFKTFDFTLVGGILIILGLIYCLTYGYNRGKKIWQGRIDEVEYIADGEVKTYSKTKMIIVSCVFVITVLLYITEWIPLPITSSVAAVLCIMTGCISQKKAITAVNWNIVGRLAGCLGLAKALEAAGGTQLISDGFKYLVGDSLTPFMFFCIIVLLTQLTSELISNSTALLIVLPIVISIAPDMGLNMYTYALGATIASGVALSCPLASSTLGMSMCVGYRFGDYFKYSFIFDVITYITIITLVPLIYGLTI
ncbi:MAG: SLC13/DASS family transporter [Ruminococcaceae bacterium]|nr:SLC13/DASS family transporter [Oscillospiraceae bacterium]